MHKRIMAAIGRVPEGVREEIMARGGKEEEKSGSGDSQRESKEKRRGGGRGRLKEERKSKG